MSGQALRLHHSRAFTLAVLALLALAGLFAAASAQAQTFPALTGRVVDNANVIPDDVEARLTQKLEALQTQSQRQLVIATLPDLQGYDISDYGYQLGRHWQIGDKERNDGALLIIAPKDRKLRIEVGYGLEPVLTDGLSSLIISQEIVPRFKAGDMPGGIEAGADAIIKQLSLPPEQAQKIAAGAKQEAKGDSPLVPMFIWLFMMSVVIIIPALLRSRGKGKRYRSDSGLGTVIMWSVLEGLASGRSSGGGGGSSFGGGGGGFSGGGGSFGGGGSSGSW